MANGQVIAYNITSFICALFVLEFGADKFIDNTAIVARRTNIPQSVIALLTAGAEWEELAVVVIALSRNRSSLAVGNIVGSVISNILAAFSLGLLFKNETPEEMFDRSSKFYVSLLLVLTILIAGLEGFGHHLLWRVVGGVIVGVFVVYVASIAFTITKGLLSPPELSDDESSESGDERDDHRTEASPSIPVHVSGIDHSSVTQPIASQSQEQPDEVQEATESPVVATVSNSTSRNATRTPKHSLIYHISFLLIGFLAIILSAYVITQAATNLVDQLGISDVLFGVVILSIATTLPEKFVAVMSGSKGHTGILVANTVGSNIFLLSLCMGILWLSTGGTYQDGSVNPTELGVMLGSTVLLTLTVWFGARWARWIGVLMLAGYVAFLALEFTVIRKVGSA